MHGGAHSVCLRGPLAAAAPGSTMKGSDPHVGCCALGCALSLRTAAVAKASDGPAQPGPSAGE